MISVEDKDLAASANPLDVIAKHLRDGDEVIRCVSAKALGAFGDNKAAPPALIEALLDQDPDVRTDAMEALTRCARPDDAEAIRRSLQGDPVKEVKGFAIECLARLDDRTSILLLRALAKDRADDQVAWEDEAGMWDDWLDVQVAAIKALGRMQANEAIEDLLDARTDELGQELDDVVFGALATIEDGGIAALFGLLRDRETQVRERAIKALTKAHPKAILPMREILLRDANPAIRRLAVDTLSPHSEAVADLTLHDSDPGVREATLAKFASTRPDLAQAALRDPDEHVRATALRAMQADVGDLAANVQAWMETAGAHLAATAATALPQLIGDRAREPLCLLATTIERPPEVRIAALRALGNFPTEDVLKTLREVATDRVRQVRTAALASLATLSKRGDEPIHRAATDMLVAAVRNGLGAGDRTAPEHEQEGEGAASFGASKVEDDVRRITISPDGEIVPVEIEPDLEEHHGRSESPDSSPSNIVEGYFPQSTLDALQARTVSGSGNDQALPQPDYELEPAKGSSSGRRRRVAVDGPDNIAADVRLIALNMAADCPGQQVDQALVEARGAANPSIRIAAFKALAQRSEAMVVSDEAVAASVAALTDTEPAIRGYAARVVRQSSSPGAMTELTACLDDLDATVRAEALKAIAPSAPGKAIAGLSDPSTLVRRVAMESLLSSGDAAALDRGLDVCLEQGRADTLAEICKNSPHARSRLVSTLGKQDLKGRQIHTALETLTLM